MPPEIKPRVLTEWQSSQSDLHPVLQRVYQGRGIASAGDLDLKFSQLPSFDTLLGISEAVACLATAIQAGQRLLIVGDFDTDGATSTALAVSALRSMGAAEVDFLVPNRFEYGYGLTPEIVAVALERHPDVIITVDNGIASVAGVAAAKAAGLQVVVTDHHLAGEVLPEADAIVNPNQPGDAFPSKNLAGVGVIFYVMLALRAHLAQLGWFEAAGRMKPKMTQFLDLVALGTIADVVSLDHVNRILVHHGLERMRAGLLRPGIRALLKVAQRDIPHLSAADMGFAVAPRLNAAGRLDDMSLGIECLLAVNVDAAITMAEALDELNAERREIESQMKQQAVEIVSTLTLAAQSKQLPSGLCLFDPDWHQGVIGIVASRIKERYHRPVVAFAPGNPAELKGSARSISGIHIRDVLADIATQHPELLQKFGGHAMAAGLTIAEKDLRAFTEAWQQTLEPLLTDALSHITYWTDGALHPQDHSLDLAVTLANSGPWGQGFPEPCFEGYFEILDQRLVGSKHLKLTLALDNGRAPIEAIAFNVALETWPNHRAKAIRAVYRLDVNRYYQRHRLQLMLDYIEVAEYPQPGRAINQAQEMAPPAIFHDHHL